MELVNVSRTNYINLKPGREFALRDRPVFKTMHCDKLCQFCGNLSGNTSFTGIDPFRQDDDDLPYGWMTCERPGCRRKLQETMDVFYATNLDENRWVDSCVPVYPVWFQKKFMSRNVSGDHRAPCVSIRRGDGNLVKGWVYGYMYRQLGTGVWLIPVSWKPERPHGDGKTCSRKSIEAWKLFEDNIFLVEGNLKVRNDEEWTALLEKLLPEVEKQGEEAHAALTWVDREMEDINGKLTASMINT